MSPTGRQHTCNSQPHSQKKYLINTNKYDNEAAQGDLRQRQLPWLLSDYKLGNKFELDLKICSLSAERKRAIQQRCRDII
ncbi:hypothetical protein E2C01_014851 [Portunus trituberculatus]|uniref:Uncharacterized protein n=1 Tax=Portunus trituberculatus TaxID=210409 RepID=A0A5B7DL97_PORTR|nr:hypothetical protein [Portunus trituberculatus]